LNAVQTIEVVARSTLYVAGGRRSNPSKLLSTFERLDMDNMQWKQLPSMPTPRFALAGAYMTGMIYAVGGADWQFTDNCCGKTVERFNLKSKR
jgi:hypothetical protein